MHCIACETFHVDAVIVEHVSIESVVEPTFQIFRTFEILLEQLNMIMSFTKIINKQSRSIAKVDIWATKSSKTHYMTMKYRGLLFNLDVDGLRVPSMCPK